MSNPHNFLKFTPTFTQAPADTGTTQGNSEAEKLKKIDNDDFALTLNAVHLSSVLVGRFNDQSELTDTMILDDVPNGVKVDKVQVALINVNKETNANFNMSFSTDGGQNFSAGFALSVLNQSTVFAFRANTPLVTFDVPQQFVDEYTVGSNSLAVKLTSSATTTGDKTDIDAVELYVFLKDTPSLKLKNGTMRVRGGNVLIKK